MTPIININAKNLMLDALTITRVSLHVASPGETGRDNELLSADYARQSCDISNADNGARALVSDVNFQMKSGDAVSFVGYWNDGTFLLAQEFTSVEFSTDGLFILKAGSTKVVI